MGAEQARLGVPIGAEGKLPNVYTILHISDLHRSPDDPISNDELISTLIADRVRSRRESPPIAEIDAIVVSGDIIQGVPLGTENHAEILETQYANAAGFIEELTDRFLGDDRARVVIVPGNHDVDWNTAFSAMTPADPADVEGLRGSLFSRSSPFRWCWKRQQLYRIHDRNTYERRFDHYRAFVDRFYEGSSNPVARLHYSELFELASGRIAVAAFNSCFDNDCFSFHGEIPEDAIARSHLYLSDNGKPYDLKIAVWHHSVEGPPRQSDYMDIDLVRRMIDKGLRLGLHGHQHRAQATPHYIRLPEKETMVVVSAGSLCAGRRELPTGTHRQYNIIEISDDCLSARIHVREMAVSTCFGPSYHLLFGGRSYIGMSWTPEKDVVGQPIDAERVRNQAAVLGAEEALQRGDHAHVVELLGGGNAAFFPYGRRLLVEALCELQRWDELAEYLSSPQDALELTTLVRALIARKDWDKARNVISEFSAQVQLLEPNRRELLERVVMEEEASR